MSGFTKSRSSSWCATTYRCPDGAGPPPLMVTLAEPGALAAPSELSSTQESETAPELPAVNRMPFVLPLVTPLAPPALVIVPPEMDQP